MKNYLNRSKAALSENMLPLHMIQVQIHNPVETF